MVRDDQLQLDGFLLHNLNFALVVAPLIVQLVRQDDHAVLQFQHLLVLLTVNVAVVSSRFVFIRLLDFDDSFIGLNQGVLIVNYALELFNLFCMARDGLLRVARLLIAMLL